MKQIREYCDRIAEAFRPEKIILFGSHAYGRPHQDSDVDVLVIFPSDRRMGRRPSLAIRRQIPAAFPVDILVKDSCLVSKRLAEGDAFLDEATHKGVLMYEASHT
jgi:predicted nucleotidyltransferase